MKDVAFISCFYNPVNFKKPVKNCISFFKNTVKSKIPKKDFFFVQIESPDVSPINVSGHVLKKNYLHLKSDSILWHKERSLNLLIDKFNLYNKYKYICWMDADVLFDEPIDSPSDGIDAFQPFIESIRQTDSYGDGSFELDAWSSTFDSNADIGLSWGVKSSILKVVGGFFDYGIVGGGDSIMAHRMVNNELKFGCRGLDEEIANYFKDNYIDVHSIGSLDNTATHLFHGNIINRKYNERISILKKYEYRPLEDLTVEHNGLYRLSNKDFENEIKDYFLSRKEDE